MKNSGDQDKNKIHDSGNKIAIEKLVNNPLLNPNPPTYSELTLRPNSTRVEGVSYLQVLMKNTAENKR
jgi:hypothetical protein